MKKTTLLGLLILIVSTVSAQIKKMHTEVLVVGGSTGGTAAGIQSARSGAKTIIAEQTQWLGGMLTAAGVSCTDGNNDLRSGIWEEFRQALYSHYQTKNLFAGWVSETCFEPHVGDSIFKAWAAHEKNLEVVYGWYFNKTIREGNKVTGAVFINTNGDKLEISADITIDGTDLGDVFADAGVKYDLGTEDSTQSGETIAPGKSNVIQDLTWAATLKDFGKGADKTIPKPPGYDATKYYCSTSDAPCKGKPYAANTQKVLDYGKLRVSKGAPDKYMLNWPAHGNDFYLNVAEMKPIDREKEYTKAKNFALGFVYFLQTELKQKQIGLAEEEMDKGLAFIPYNREGRRVRGVVRLNIDHIKSPFQSALYRTGISVGDYPVDHHHAQYPGKVPPIPFPQVPSYSIPLGALIPEKIEGLIVCEKGISVSNIANGTTRLQPVVLLTGQAAGMLAAKSIQQKKQPLQITVREVQDELLKNKCYIVPYMDVKVDDLAWEPIQRIGSLGIIHGVGKSVGWANKTYFYPDSVLSVQEINANLINTFPGLKIQSGDRIVNIACLVKLVNELNQFIHTNGAEAKKIQFIKSYFINDISAKEFELAGLNRYNAQRPLTRKEFSVLLNSHILFWNYVEKDFMGNVYLR